jgi:hypothetical protein
MRKKRRRRTGRMLQKMAAGDWRRMALVEGGRSGSKFTPHRQCRFVRLIAEGQLEEFARGQRAGVLFERFVGGSEMLN